MTSRRKQVTTRKKRPDKPAPFSWFPPHMLQAQKRLLAEIKTADLVLEIRDARLPRLSANPTLDRIVAGRQRLVIFNKASLADPQHNARWRRHYERMAVQALFLDVEEPSAANRILTRSKSILQPWAAAFRARDIRPPPPRLMVIGIPNVGKSTLVNRLLHSKRQPVAPHPGVTRRTGWVQLKGRISLLDSPGVLLPRIESERDAFRLSWTGAIPDQIVGAERLAVELIRDLSQRERVAMFDHPTLPIARSDIPELILEKFAAARNMTIKGGKPDLTRAAELLLREFRRGILGAITFEHPEESSAGDADSQPSRISTH